MIFDTSDCLLVPAFSYKSRYIIGFGLVEMAISTTPKPTANVGPAS